MSDILNNPEETLELNGVNYTRVFDVTVRSDVKKFSRTISIWLESDQLNTLKKSR